MKSSQHYTTVRQKRFRASSESPDSLIVDKFASMDCKKSAVKYLQLLWVDN